MSKKLVPTSLDKILVAVDGSDHSKKAVDWAIEIASKYNSKIYLIHVLEQKKNSKGFGDCARSERMPISSYFDLVCNQFVGDAAARAKDGGAKKVEIICERGNPSDKIINSAKKNNVDLIIMGSRGLGGFSRTIMGSVSTKVCNHADRTCITVK